MRTYLFAMPHMKYPKEARDEFFESCYQLSCYLDKNMEMKKSTVEPEVMFLMRTTSVRTTALLSVWEGEELLHGSCTCCGKDLPVIKFADCKAKQHTHKLVEEWDLLTVAKNMTMESKENFSLYKKVAKVYGAYTCKECGMEQTLLDAYMNWCYANTQLTQPKGNRNSSREQTIRKRS